MPKDKMITRLAMLLVIAVFLVYGLHQTMVVHHSQLHIKPDRLVLFIIVLVPALLYVAALAAGKRESWSKLVPWLNMLTITGCSIAMISAGYGMIEYHFSIFMVLAIISYYENIRMLLVMSVLFLIQHLMGFFYFTEYVFGVATGTYSFTMMLYHALFLLGTSGALIWQISHKRRLRQQLQTTMVEQQQLEDLLQQMKLSSHQLADVSGQLEYRYDKAQKELEIMAGFVRNISEDAQQHSKLTHNTSEAVNGITVNLQQISNANVEIVDGAQQMASKAVVGKDLMEHTMEQMQQLRQQSRQYSTVIARLYQQADRVGQITDFIKTITKQTRILSLNASIEAAKAGSYGKGFAIIAAEIGKLAQQTNSATSDIINLVTEVEKEAKDAVVQMNQLNLQVEQGVAYTTDMMSLLNDITTLITQATKQFELVSQSTEEIAASTLQANAEIAELSSIAQDIGGKAEQAAQTTQRQLELNSQLAPLIASLNAISRELKM